LGLLILGIKQGGKGREFEGGNTAKRRKKSAEE